MLLDKPWSWLRESLVGPSQRHSPSLQLEQPSGKEVPDELGALQGRRRREYHMRVGGTLEASHSPSFTTGGA